MENRFKMRISRMFRGSFGSCRTRNLSDLIEEAVSFPQNQKKFHFQIIAPLSPKAPPFPSICRPKCSDSLTESGSIVSRQKVSARCPPPFLSANFNGQTCPPASPISPLNPFDKDYNFDEKQKGSISEENKKKNKNKKKKKKKKENSPHLKSNYRRDKTLFSSSSQEDSQYYGGSYWFSSDEDGEKEFDGEENDETDTLFSSRSLSSDSSGSRRYSRRRRHHYRRKQHSSSTSANSSRRHTNNNGAAVHEHREMDVLPLAAGKVKGSFAVVKSSSDPYNDFRTSMVEMIVEKRIFAAEDLEQLLQCFLSLNSRHHHGIIVEVFTEILETLFSNWS